MATISTNTYLDGGVARTAGEAWTIGGNATLTVRTDTRVHANAPASMTGTFGSFTINEGTVLLDGRNVRWMAYNTGSGNVPAIGTTVSRGGVSGYLLGVYASLTVAPTTVGSAMPASGFLKFREVTNGPFTAGALSGIGASATAPDKVGWIEVVADQSSNHTLASGLAAYTIRGDWFYLDDTNGSLGQVLQVPTNGGAGYAFGAYVESAPGSGEYEFWGVAQSATDGWSLKDAAAPRGATDKRQRVLKAANGGTLQFGEDADLSGTYAATASTAVTAYSSYQWSSMFYYAEGTDCYLYSSSGFTALNTGDTVHVDFTSGTHLALDGYYVVERISATLLKITTASSLDGGGVVTIRAGLTLTVASGHPYRAGDTVHVQFATGSGVSGVYTVFATATTSVSVLYQHSVNPTTGTAAIHRGITITTSAAHGLIIGQSIKCDFTSGTAVDGTFTIAEVPTTTTLVILSPFYGGTGGNVTMQFTIGHVPVTGCKVRIPNVIMRQCATGTRATNALLHATATTRPEFATTATGEIDFQFAYCDWYLIFSQATAVNVEYSIICGRLVISEIDSLVTLSGVGVSGLLAENASRFSLSYLTKGAVITDCSACVDTIAPTNQYALELSYNKDVTVTDFWCNHLGANRTTSAYAIYIGNSEDTLIERLISIGFTRAVSIATSFTTNIIDTDFCSSITGCKLTAAYCFGDGAMCTGTKIDGLTLGLNGAIPNQAPVSAIATITGHEAIVRNIGSFNAPLDTYNFRGYSPSYIVELSGNSREPKIQRCYVTDLLGQPVYMINNQYAPEISEVFVTRLLTSLRALNSLVIATSDAIVRSYRYPGYLGNTGSAAVYGVHLSDHLHSDVFGTMLLTMNAPTAATQSQVVILAGTPKFTNAGTIYMFAVGDSIEITDNVFRKGFTGFNFLPPLIDGLTLANHDIKYQIDTGSGFSDWKNLSLYRTLTYTVNVATINDVDTADIQIGDRLYSSNFRGIAKVIDKVGNVITMDRTPHMTTSSAIHVYHMPEEVIDPSVGFKLKIKITTVIANTSSGAGIRMPMNTTALAQSSVHYPLDTIQATFTGLPSGTDMVVLEAGTSNILNQQDAVAGSSIIYEYEEAHNVDVGFIKPGYIPYYFRNLALGTTDTSLPVTMTPDRNYT